MTMRRIDRPAARICLVLLAAFALASAHAATHKGGDAKTGGGNVWKAAGVRAPKGKGIGAAIAPQTGDANLRIEKQIVAIKAATDAGVRAEAAGGLIDAIIGASPASITPQTISDLAALLANRDNVVRYWTALTLAQVGPHASSAAPALDRALKDAEKLKADDSGSPANGICLAFLRIGVKPEDGRCVNGEYLDAKQKAAYDASQASKAAQPAPQPAKNVTAAPAPAAQ
jgi:hypothetical protein